MSLNEPIANPYERTKHWNISTSHIDPSICLLRINPSSWSSTAGKYIILGDLVVYFHYEAVVAFFTPPTGLIISENFNSSSSLGRMLNLINKDKNIRIDQEEVLNQLKEYIREDFYF